jgi:hypothetical protein
MSNKAKGLATFRIGKEYMVALLKCGNISERDK